MQTHACRRGSGHECHLNHKVAELEAYYGQSCEIKHILAAPEGRAGGNRLASYGNVTLVEMERVPLKSPFEDGFHSPLDNRWSSVYHQFLFEGRMSSMTKETQQRTAVLQGTLDMLILRTLIYGAAHGHQIGKHIQRTTNDFLQMQHGSLYPALHRLEKRGWVVSKWETSPDRNREFKYYRLTEKGKEQLVAEESQWRQMTEAVARVMWPTAEGS